jgi:hypothetical protein
MIPLMEELYLLIEDDCISSEPNERALPSFTTRGFLRKNKPTEYGAEYSWYITDRNFYDEPGRFPVLLDQDFSVVAYRKIE